MIQVIAGEAREPERFAFGPLEALVDANMAPGAGTKTHHHRNTEILTIVLDGVMTNKDARDQVSVIPAGVAHRLSSGLGVTHAEANLRDAPARYLQVRIRADIRGVLPEEEQRPLAPGERLNRLEPIVTGEEDIEGMMWYADATVYLGDLTDGQAISWVPRAGRGGYLYVYGGALTVNGQAVRCGDAARVAGESKLELVGQPEARLILVDLPA